MADRSLGKVMMIPKGAYNATSIYNKLDFVIDDGTSYVALEDNITNKKPKDNPTKWQILASGIAVVSEEHTYAAQSQEQYTGEPPATGWQQTIPEAIPGGYLWTKTVITYENQQTATNYLLVKNGQNGIATAEDVSFDPDFAYSSGTVGKELTEQSSQIANIQDLLNSFNDFLRGIIPAEYSTSTTYAVGAVCCHNNRLYQATQTTSGTWNASHWTQVRINNVAVLSYSEV